MGKHNKKSKKVKSGKIRHAYARLSAAQQLRSLAELGEAAELSALIQRNLSRAATGAEEPLDVNACDEHGKTALHAAAINGHLEVTQVLLSAGAQLNAVDNFAWTPLHCASSGRNERLIKFLLEQPGIKATMVNSDRNTPLHYLAKNATTSTEHIQEILTLLLKKARGAADINVHNYNGETPLHNAALSGNATFVLLLLENGAEPNLQNDHGETPLHWAARQGFFHVVKTLLDAGAALVSGMFGTPVDVATDSQVLGYLRQNQSSVQLRQSTQAASQSANAGTAGPADSGLVQAQIFVNASSFSTGGHDETSHGTSSDDDDKNHDVIVYTDTIEHREDYQHQTGDSSTVGDGTAALFREKISVGADAGGDELDADETIVSADAIEFRENHEVITDDLKGVGNSGADTALALDRSATGGAVAASDTPLLNFALRISTSKDWAPDELPTPIEHSGDDDERDSTAARSAEVTPTEVSTNDQKEASRELQTIGQAASKTFQREKKMVNLGYDQIPSIEATDKQEPTISSPSTAEQAASVDGASRSTKPRATTTVGPPISRVTFDVHERSTEVKTELTRTDHTTVVANTAAGHRPESRPLEDANSEDSSNDGQFGFLARALASDDDIRVPEAPDLHRRRGATTTGLIHPSLLP